MLGNYRVAAQLVASQVVLSSTELVSVARYIVGEMENVYELWQRSECFTPENHEI
jgi:hypothetical protein